MNPKVDPGALLILSYFRTKPKIVIDYKLD